MNPNPSEHASAAELHRMYVNLTALEIPLDMSRIYQWEVFIAKKFTATDLSLVIRHIQKGIRERKRNPGALKFRNLIGSIDLFEEDLAESRAAANIRSKSSRPMPPTPKRADGREMPTVAAGPKTDRKVGEIVATKAFQDFIALRNSL